MADALREWSALSAVAAQEGLIPTSYGSAAVTPSLSSARHPIFVTEHHLNEVRKCFERLVKKYAGADFRNTNTEAGCIWNDAVNLANGINATHSASGPTNGGTCAKCQRSFTSEDYCPICSNPSEGQWQMLRKDERGT